ncbi:PREDICTED: uncharacterized protein LOC109485364 [Branchiostoma belcheri]|uniref:Uncharacterized protein LOC109485364 n=1 Tax=Branchiostoma belcheri TaxID=7741 RepID=A0A6P5AR43_BRABE|nr:PREDICTED: uncharacterized protein LOC109485364 [Branchiostoma belcheri]
MFVVFLVVFLAVGVPSPGLVSTAPAPAKEDFFTRQIWSELKKLASTVERHEEMLVQIELFFTHVKGVEAKVSVLEEKLMEIREKISADPDDPQQVEEAENLQLPSAEENQETACRNEDGYQSLGCWRDTYRRAIPSLERQDPLLDGHYSERQDALTKCYTVARALGMKIFALQNGGWCAGSPDENVNFKVYGPSTQCYIGGEGGPFSNHVYEIIDTNCDTEEKSISFRVAQVHHATSRVTHGNHSVMAAAGGDEPRRPPGPAHLYGSYKKLLLGIFDDMDNGEYRSFKHHLDCVVSSDNVSIPKARIMRAKRLDMPDLILRYIPRREALQVVARILQELPNVQLLERIQQFTHPEPGSFGNMVLQIKHAAESEEDYLRTCQDIADALNRCSQGLGNLILDEVRHRECVLVKYLLNVEELSLKRPADIIQKMASEQCKKELRHLGVIYITVEDSTLFTGELHNDPRAWDHVEVTQWVGRILLPSDQTATIPDLRMTGAEICARPQTWFTDEFPVGIGKVLYTDLQERRDDVAHQRKFGGRQEENERVVEKTSATFLVSAYLMSMILTLLGQHRGKAGDILEYLRSLIQVTERQSKKTLHSGDFNYSWASKNIIKERSSLPSSAASVVFGSKAIAISREAYSQVVTSVVEAMEVVGAPLEVKIKSPWLGLRRAITIVVCFAAGLEAGLAAGLVAGLGAVLAAVPVVGFDAGLIVALNALYESEKKTAFYKVNYLQALILLPKVLLESEMEGYKLDKIKEQVQDERKRCSTQEAERKMMELLPHVSSRLAVYSKFRVRRDFDYRAKEWLHDSISNINDTMIIAHAHFELRRLLREVFVLGVVGSAHSGKTTLVKSVLGEKSAHHTTTGPYDVKLYDGSDELEEETLPVLAFPSGPGKEVDAAHRLCVGICTAFICVVECKTGKIYMYILVFPDIRALARVAHLSVPVLLCVNKCGRVKNKRQASQVLDSYNSAVSREFEGLSSLTQVVLTDFHTTHNRPAWLTGAEGVKYWILDAIQNHKRYVRNAEAELQVFERELSL